MKVRVVAGLFAFAVAVLIVPAGASAATALYKGTSDAGGKLVFTTGISKGQTDVLLTARGSGYKPKCDGYPEVPAGAFDFNPGTTPAPGGQHFPVYVDNKNRFSFKFTQASSGLVSYLKGKVGKNGIKGTFRMRTHLNAGLGFEEADCDTGAVDYRLQLTSP